MLADPPNLSRLTLQPQPQPLGSTLLDMVPPVGPPMVPPVEPPVEPPVGRASVRSPRSSAH